MRLNSSDSHRYAADGLMTARKLFAGDLKSVRRGAAEWSAEPGKHPRFNDGPRHLDVAGPKLTVGRGWPAGQAVRAGAEHRHDVRISLQETIACSERTSILGTTFQP